MGQKLQPHLEDIRFFGPKFKYNNVLKILSSIQRNVFERISATESNTITCDALRYVEKKWDKECLKISIHSNHESDNLKRSIPQSILLKNVFRTFFPAKSNATNNVKITQQIQFCSF